MFINKFLLLFVCSLSVAQASTSSVESDVYGDQVPKPFTTKGIRYTTPALQGIYRNHLSVEDVEKIVKSQSGNKFGSIHQDNVYLLLRKCEDGLSTEIASVWKE